MSETRRWSNVVEFRLISAGERRHMAMLFKSLAAELQQRDAERKLAAAIARLPTNRELKGS